MPAVAKFLPLQRPGRLIDPHHQRPCRRKGGQEQVQQDTTGAPPRPGGAVQDAMMGLKGRQVTQPNSALAVRWPGLRISADEEFLDMAPDGPREKRRGGPQECDTING